MELTFEFLLESFVFQIKAAHCFEKQFKFLSPFSDSSTKTSYLFKLFSILQLNDENIHSIPRDMTGVPMNSSKPELEFVSFMVHKYPQNRLIHAFSPYG